MTLQKSLFNPKLAFEDIKQNKHVVFLYTVILLMCTLFPASLEYSNYFADTVNNSYCLQNTADMLPLANPFVMLLAFAAAFIIAILQFNYLYKQNSVIFVHSMPYTRANIIVTKYVSGLLMTVLPILWVGLINMLAVKVMGVEYLVSYKDFVKSLAYGILSVTFCYSVIVMAQTVASSIFSLFIAASFVFLLYPITKGVAMVMVSSYLKTYEVETLFSRELDFIFPIWKVATAEDAANALTVGFTAYLVIASIVMLIISALVYSKRKSENSNKFFAFNAVNKFLKFYITIVLALGVGGLTGQAASGNFGMAYAMYIVAAIIIFAVLQAIFDKNIKNMFANKLSLGAVLLIVTAVSCAFKFDVLKLNDRVPDANDTKTIEVTVPLISGNGYVSNEKYDFTDKKVIEKSILLMKNGEYARDRGWTSDDDFVEITFATDRYKKLGISRRVLVKKTDYSEFQRLIFESGELQAQIVPTEEEMNEIYWTYATYLEDNFNIQTKGDIEKLIKTLSEEFKTLTADEFANENTVGWVEFEIPRKTNGSGARSFFYRRIPVYESFTETIDFLEKYNNDRIAKAEADDKAAEEENFAEITAAETAAQ